MNMINYKAKHFNYSVKYNIGLISLTGSKQKNPLTFESYGELRDFFREINNCEDIDAIIFGSKNGNFCSGGSVNDIIGPLINQPDIMLSSLTTYT